MNPLQILLTLDVDWAPDFIIEHTASILLDAGVKATWFVTHESPAIDELRNHPELFELGIHPNFHAGSTHGRTPEEIVAFCMNVVPEARSFKSHALLESTPLLEVVMKNSPVEVDLTTLLPGFCLRQPVLYEWKNRLLWRLSCCWEDNFQFCCRKPIFSMDDMGWLTDGGIAAFTFHPIHICLNASRYEEYKSFKRRGPLETLTPRDVLSVRKDAMGTEDLFRELVAHAARKANSARVKDTVNKG